MHNATDFLNLDFNYGTTNNNGNVLSQTITTPAASGAPAFTAVQTYTYDSLNRIKDARELVGATQTWRQVYSFDRYGNRNFASGTTTITGCPTNICNPSVNPANNRFNSGQGYTYDLSGNTVSDAEGRTYIYDAENKQKQVKNSANQTIGTYFYDGDGKRIKKVTASKTVTFVYNAGGKLVAEYSTLTPQTTPVTRYLTSDHLGSPRIITGSNGAVLSRRDFMPYGEEAYIGVGNRAVGHGYTYGDSTRQKFTGYERDEETDLDFAQARMHNYNHGRFTSPDPLFFQIRMLIDPQMFNSYVYTRNNPLVHIDPDGMEFRISARGNSEQAMEDVRRLAGDFADNLTFTAVYDDDGNLSYHEVGFELYGPELNNLSEGAKLIWDLVANKTVFMGQRGGTLQQRVKEGRSNAGEISTVDVEEKGGGNVTRERPGRSGIYEPVDEGVDSIFFWSDEPAFEVLGGGDPIDSFSIMVHEAAESYLLAQGIEYNTAHGIYYDDFGSYTRNYDNAISREKRIHYELRLTTPRSHRGHDGNPDMQRIRRGN